MKNYMVVSYPCTLKLILIKKKLLSQLLVVGLDSRGFLLGPVMAQECEQLNSPKIKTLL